MIPSTNIQAPFFGPRLPEYPLLRQIVRVGPSSSSASGSGNVYSGWIEQSYGDAPAFRDREGCIILEPNGLNLAPGSYHKARLIGNLDGLPLLAVSVLCCVPGSFGSSSGSSFSFSPSSSPSSPSSGPSSPSSRSLSSSSSGSFSPVASSSSSSSPFCRYGCYTFTILLCGPCVPLNGTWTIFQTASNYFAFDNGAVSWTMSIQPGSSFGYDEPVWLLIGTTDEVLVAYYLPVSQFDCNQVNYMLELIPIDCPCSSSSGGSLVSLPSSSVSVLSSSVSAPSSLSSLLPSSSSSLSSASNACWMGCYACPAGMPHQWGFTIAGQADAALNGNWVVTILQGCTYLFTGGGVSWQLFIQTGSEDNASGDVWTLQGLHGVSVVQYQILVSNFNCRCPNLLIACTTCTGTIPATWTVTVSGCSGCYSIFNDTYQMAYNNFNCCWSVVNESGATATFCVDQPFGEAELVLFDPASGAEINYLASACMLPLVNPCCQEFAVCEVHSFCPTSGEFPASLTVTPDCTIIAPSVTIFPLDCIGICPSSSGSSLSESSASPTSPTSLASPSPSPPPSSFVLQCYYDCDLCPDGITPGFTFTVSDLTGVLSPLNGTWTILYAGNCAFFYVDSSVSWSLAVPLGELYFQLTGTVLANGYVAEYSIPLSDFQCSGNNILDWLTLCPQCVGDDYTVENWTLVGSGFTGCYSAFNNTFTMPQLDPNACNWGYHLGSIALTLNIGSDGHIVFELQDFSTGATVVYFGCDDPYFGGMGPFEGINCCEDLPLCLVENFCNSEGVAPSPLGLSPECVYHDPITLVPLMQCGSSSNPSSSLSPSSESVISPVFCCPICDSLPYQWKFNPGSWGDGNFTDCNRWGNGQEWVLSYQGQIPTGTCVWTSPDSSDPNAALWALFLNTSLSGFCVFTLVAQIPNGSSAEIFTTTFDVVSGSCIVPWEVALSAGDNCDPDTVPGSITIYPV